MERLTRRIGDHVYYTQGMYEDTLPVEMETQDVRKVLKKLAAYEDAEEQGAPLVESPTWIPCSEKMPSEHDYPEQKHRVLASCSDGIVRNASIKSMLNGEKKYALGHIEFTYEAWMPLPEPYKGEQHETD